MRFVFTCGGTAGHINPAIAVAESIKSKLPDSEFLFIGAEGQMELELVPREGYSIKPIRVTNISRGRSLSSVNHNINAVRNAAGAIIKSKKIISEFGADAVIGTGGYVCFPVITAARELKIPTFVHESNAVPGLTTRMLSHSADNILVGFEESRQYYSERVSVSVTGTPVRNAFGSMSRAEARARLGLKDEPLVLSVWGSLGSGFMNKTIREMLPLMNAASFRLIHSTGKMYYPDFEELLNGSLPVISSGAAEIRDYLYNIPELMIAADLVICRAGASTISELTYLGRPALIVPSPNVTDNHQEKNARVLERAGAAAVMTENELTPQSFLERLEELIENKEVLKNMEENMLRLGNKKAADDIAAIILSKI